MKIKPWVFALGGLAAVVPLLTRIIAQAQLNDVDGQQELNRINRVKALSLSGQIYSSALGTRVMVPAQDMRGVAVTLRQETAVRIVSLDKKIATVRVDAPGGQTFRVMKTALAWQDGADWKPVYLPDSNSHLVLSIP